MTDTPLNLVCLDSMKDAIKSGNRIYEELA